MMRPVVAPVLVGMLVLALWQGFCVIKGVPAYVFPAPSDVARSIITNFPALLFALVSTLKVTFLALTLSVVIGVMIAFLFVQSRLFELSFFPYVLMLQVTPIVSIAPLIIILVKSTFWSLTICATIIAIFPIISNTTIGLRSVDPGLLSYFQMNKASRWQTLIRLRIPSALPLFVAGLRISSGLALVGAVVAEFVAGTGGRGAGLAYEILQAGFQVDIPRMFAALALITLAGLVLWWSTSLLSHALLGWDASSQDHNN